MVVALSRWLGRKAAWPDMIYSLSAFVVLQVTILILKDRLALAAPAQEPPLDYRARGYTPADALAVMGGYSGPARALAAALEATDVLYSLAYAPVFAGFLALGLSGCRAPKPLHLLNLVPLAASAADVVENALMLALLAAPGSAALARAVAPVSQLKWSLLGATGTMIVGFGGLAFLRAKLFGKRRPVDAAKAA